MNAQTWAKKFRARLLEPGLVSYNDVGCGVAFVSKATIDRCINSFVGRPVVVRHTKTSPANMKDVGHGYVTAVEYDQTDGWWYGVGVVDTDEAVKRINEWGFGSVGYAVKKTGRGGEHHAIPYDEEILEFSGEHLAIVDRPRYEGATIRLNSKTKPKMNLFKWVKKAASRSNAPEAPVVAPTAAPQAAPTETPEQKTARENAVASEEITGETELEIPTGEGDTTEKVTLNDLIADRQNARAGVSPDAEIEVDGKAVKVSDLVAGFKANSAPTETPDQKLARENAAKPAAPAVKKGTFFKVLMNAANKPAALEGAPAKPDSLMDRCNRGAELYGSAKLAGKN